MRLARALAALTIPLLFLSACGEESGAAADPTPTASDSLSESSSPTPTAEPTPGSPQCTEVWVEGATLPAKYKGCYEGTEKVKTTSQYCEFGRSIVAYGDHYFAVRTGTITKTAEPLQESEKFKDAMKKCLG